MSGRHEDIYTAA